MHSINYFPYVNVCTKAKLFHTETFYAVFPNAYRLLYCWISRQRKENPKPQFKGADRLIKMRGSLVKTK